MTNETLAYISAAVALVGIMAYAVLGGADFGGGIWDLFATGPRKREQRDAITRAMGPVWEANHVWLIFVAVVLFTCFPVAYVTLLTALFIPFHLAIIGIMLRGAAFAFRGYSAKTRPTGSQKGSSTGGSDVHAPVAAARERSNWSAVFGVASTITPILLGAAFGAVTAGGVELGADGRVIVASPAPWARPYSLGCGLLALSTCAYLAAVYLTVETGGALRDDFRKRAIIAGTSTAALAGIVLALAWHQAPWFFKQLTGPRAMPVLAAGLVFFAGSAWAVFSRRYRLSRWFAAGEIVLLLIGWGLAQQPYLVYPTLKIVDSAGPVATIRFLLLALPVGAIFLVPALAVMFRVFKSSRPAGPMGAS
jgi:cytochrome bd ubiquinol oxidase subunit II